MITAANAHVAWWWGGREVGWISPLASAAIFNGMEFASDGAVARPGWGLPHWANAAREIAAMRDLQAFSA